MADNGLQKPSSLEEQLNKLKKEQAEAERIYKGRMELGSLIHDPESLKVLAQTIVDRKIKIDDLQAQIDKQNLSKEDMSYQEDLKEGKEKQTALTVQYNGRNPILKFLQKIMNKLEAKIQQLDERSKRDPMDWYKEKFEQEMEYLNSQKYSEYERMANVDLEKSTQIQRPKTAHELFVEKISGNGAYHTYGKNYANITSQTRNANTQIKKVEDPTLSDR